MKVNKTSGSMKTFVSCIIFIMTTLLVACTTTPKADVKPWMVSNTDTLTTPSGLQYLIVHASGNSVKAQKGKVVDVHYTGFLTDGKVFDSSIPRNEPFRFALGQHMVIEGWEEGIALMHVGDKYRFIIPADLGYGAHGAGSDIPPNATLLFDVELVNVR